MSNTSKLEQEYTVTDGALCDPMFHFIDYLTHIEHGDSDFDPKDYEESFNRYFNENDYFLKPVYFGFVAGFNASTKLWVTLIRHRNSSDNTTTTETTK